ncbi:hypothetical protein L1887_38317 [Cichorium endivia]|nr:hypothetical protein L1887_38317 [Cichorium endivia]
METNVTQWATPIHPMVTLIIFFLPTNPQFNSPIRFLGFKPNLYLSLSSQLSLSSTNPSLDLDFADLDRCFAATAAVIGLQF